MLHRYLLEAFDRTLQDLMDLKVPFGGKTLILSGDFRQCLPVVKGAGRAATVDVTLKRSYLWKQFVVKQLKENMRILQNNDSELKRFDSWSLSSRGERPKCTQENQKTEDWWGLRIDWGLELYNWGVKLFGPKNFYWIPKILDPKKIFLGLKSFGV